MELEPFETAILQWIADHTDDDELRQQLQVIDASTRTFTWLGSYTELTVPDSSAPRTNREYGRWGPIDGPYFQVGEIDGGTLLWFVDGYAENLEIYTHQDGFAGKFPNPAEVVFRSEMNPV